MREKRIFIFAYYSFKDPVFQSAVLQYFTDFPHKEQFRFILLTFEQERYRIPNTEIAAITAELKNHNIDWYYLNWHSGRLKMLKKAYDFCNGFFKSVYLVFRFRPSIIYSEAFPSAIIAHWVCRFTMRKHIIHTFEPHADYMVEGGVWKKNSWETIVLKYFEQRVAKRAYAILTATEAMIRKLSDQSITAKLIRVPSCVDTNVFQFDASARKQVRTFHGLGRQDIAIVYIGKMGGMYWEKEIFQFFRACLNTSDRFFFFFFSPDDLSRAKKYALEAAIPPERIFFSFLKREEVPSFLSAADYGVVPVHQYPSKRYCSPIKDGEYWACGLPIIIQEGVSDDFEFTAQQELGIVISKMDADTFHSVAAVIVNEQDGTPEKEAEMKVKRQRCRDFVLKDRDVQKYKEKYYDLFCEIEPIMYNDQSIQKSYL